MKKIFVAIFIIFSSLPFLISATGENNISLEGVLSQIKKSQGAEKTSDINCDKVADEQFEKLGNAAMSLMHPEERQHELMNKMMGGEGSESLKAMHILMGEKYLGCDSGQMGMMGNSGATGMMNMIGSEGMMSMMGNWSNPSALNNYSNNPMMNFSFTPFGWFGWIFMILFWVLIVVGIVALIKWLVGEMGSGRKEKSALDIFKERYAKGEISKEEFEEKKKDLT